MRIYFGHLLSLTLLLSCAAIKVNGQCSGLKDGYYSDTRQCDAWIKCENGQFVEQGLCPDGLVFNENGNVSHLRCQLPFGIDCSQRPGLQPAQPTSECPRQFGMYRYDQDCTQFFVCSDGVATPKNCPEGLLFSNKHGVCDWPDQVEGCVLPRSLSFPCPEYDPDQYLTIGDPRYPDTTDCRKLYVCVRTPVGEDRYVLQARHLGCEEGLVFNPVANQCDDPRNVSGCERYYDNYEKSIYRSPPGPTASRPLPPPGSWSTNQNLSPQGLRQPPSWTQSGYARNAAIRQPSTGYRPPPPQPPPSRPSWNTGPTSSRLSLPPRPSLSPRPAAPSRFENSPRPLSPPSWNPRSPSRPSTFSGNRDDLTSNYRVPPRPSPLSGRYPVPPSSSLQ